MSNVPLMFQPLVKYVEFQGRSRRSEFWLWVLFRMLVGSALGTIIGTVLFSNISGMFGSPHPDPQQFLRAYMGSMMTIIPLANLVSLGLLLPTIAVGVRRLHDIGRTGWWLIMPHVVAIVCVIIIFVVLGAQIFPLLGQKDVQMSDAQGLHFALTIMGTMALCALPILASWIVLLVFFVTEGKRGPNRFGPDPKGEALNDTP